MFTRAFHLQTSSSLAKLAYTFAGSEASKFRRPLIKDRSRSDTKHAMASSDTDRPSGEELAAGGADIIPHSVKYLMDSHPLSWACKLANNAAALTRRIADLRGPGGHTRLDAAVMCGRTERIRQLAEAAANVNLRNDNIAPLFRALMCGRIDSLEALLSLDAVDVAGAIVAAAKDDWDDEINHQPLQNFCDSFEEAKHAPVLLTFLAHPKLRSAVATPGVGAGFLGAVSCCAALVAETEVLGLALASASTVAVEEWAGSARLQCVWEALTVAASHNHAHLVAWYMAQLQDPDELQEFKSGGLGTNLASVAAGSLPFLRAVHEHGLLTAEDREGIQRHAATEGHVLVLKWCKDSGDELHPESMARAAEAGRLHVLQWMHAQGWPVLEDRRRGLWDAAIKSGNVDTVRWVMSHGGSLTVYACATAAKHGHLKVLQALHAAGCPWDASVICNAVRAPSYSKLMDAESLKIVQWAVTAGAPLSAEACREAVHRGYLPTLEFLIGAGCPWEPTECVAAAASDDKRVGILRWILGRERHLELPNLEKICAGAGMTVGVYANPPLECLDVMLAAGYPVSASVVLDGLANGLRSWDEMYGYIHESDGAVGRGCACPEPKIEDNVVKALQWCASHGAVFEARHAAAAAGSNSLRALHVTRECGHCPLDEAAFTAATRAHYTGMDTLRYLKDQGCPWNTDACTAAAEQAWWEALHWLHEHGCPWDARVCEALRAWQPDPHADEYEFEEDSARAHAKERGATEVRAWLDGMDGGCPCGKVGHGNSTTS